MPKYSVREVLEMALQTEKMGFEFYTSMAEKFKDHKGLSDLFGKLALQEQVHESIFEKLLGGIPDEEPEGWQEAQSYFRALAESEFFLGRAKALPSMSSVKTVRDAVDFAIGFERESLLFYVSLRDSVRDKATMDEVISEENSHILWLTGLRESIAG